MPADIPDFSLAKLGRPGYEVVQKRREFFVLNKPSGRIFLVCLPDDNLSDGKMAKQVVIGTIPDLDQDYNPNDFIAQEKPEMKIDDVLEVNELGQCEDLKTKIRNNP
jgi:hypothetical protein